MQNDQCRSDSVLQSFKNTITKTLSGKKFDDALSEVPKIIGKAIEADFVALVRCQPHLEVRQFWWTSDLVSERLGPKNAAASIPPGRPSANLRSLGYGLPDLYGFGRIMAVPVKEEDELWGYILAAGYQTDRSWTETEETIIKTAADCICSAGKKPEPDFELFSSCIQLRQSLKMLPNIIFKARLSGGSWYISFAEGALAARLATKYGQLRGRLFADIFPSGPDAGHSLGDVAAGRTSEFISEADGSAYLITAGPAALWEAGLTDGVELIGTITDITERRRAETIIRRQALHDPLTSLPNRILLRDRLAAALADAKRKGRLAAVLFLDLDFFKQINDNAGHCTGDRLLQAIAGRLKNSTRASDTVARLGGDEFTIVLPDLGDKTDVKEVAERILTALEHPFIINGKELKITASIGISLYPQDGADIGTLMKKADSALYLAKSGGKNQYRFYNPDTTKQ